MQGVRRMPKVAEPPTLQFSVHPISCHFTQTGSATTTRSKPFSLDFKVLQFSGMSFTLAANVLLLYAYSQSFSQAAFAIIFRLKQTWDLLADKYIALRNELDELCQQQGNYKNLRAKITEDQEHNKKALLDSSVTACPIIPYLGMFLTDLTFGEEGNSDYVRLRTSLDNFQLFVMFTQVPTEHFSVEDKVMFNVAKLTLMSKTIMQLRSYCSGSYPFVFNKSYHQLLCSLQVCILFELNAVALNFFAVTLPVPLCYKIFLSPAILFR